MSRQLKQRRSIEQEDFPFSHSFFVLIFFLILACLCFFFSRLPDLLSDALHVKYEI